jgi:hypothetical protein
LSGMDETHDTESFLDDPRSMNTTPHLGL